VPNAYESFDKANSTTIGPNHIWTKGTEGNTHNVTSNALSGTGTGLAASRCEVTTDNGDMRVNGVVKAIAQFGSIGVVARANTTGAAAMATGYVVEVSQDGKYYISKATGTSSLTYYKDAVALPGGLGTLPKTLEIQVEGSTIRMYWGGTLIDTWTDTAIPANTNNQRGSVVTYFANGTTSLDDFRAEVLTQPVAGTHVDSFQDDFDGSALNATRWPTASAGVTVGSGQLTIAQETTYYSVLSQYLDFLNGAVHAKVTSPPNSTTPLREDGLTVEADTSNKVEVIHYGTGLFFKTTNAGTATEISVTYDATAHAYRRIRFTSATAVVFETSPSGNAGSWTQRHTSTVNWNVRNARIRLWTGTTGATGQVTLFDKVNIALATLSLGGSLAMTGVHLRSSFLLETGSVAPAGTLSMLKVAFLSLAGSLTPSGLMSRLGFLEANGILSPTGVHLKLPQLVKTGSSAPAATFKLAVLRTLTSTVALTGDSLVLFLGRVFGRAGTLVMKVWARGSVRLRVRRPT
jgi:hypothetical protein